VKYQTRFATLQGGRTTNETKERCRSALNCSASPFKRLIKSSYEHLKSSQSIFRQKSPVNKQIRSYHLQPKGRKGKVSFVVRSLAALESIGVALLWWLGGRAWQGRQVIVAHAISVHFGNDRHSSAFHVRKVMAELVDILRNSSRLVELGRRTHELDFMMSFECERRRKREEPSRQQ
jgi:hypothetical protein